MKKYVFVLLLFATLFLGINVQAKVFINPNIEFYVSNPDGAEIGNGTIQLGVIPAQTRIKLLSKDSNDGYYVVMYNGQEANIKNTDIKPVEKTLNKESGYELKAEETVKVFAQEGLQMYEGPSKDYYDKANMIIPKGTEITYKYKDYELNKEEYYAYVTYENISGWVYISLKDENVALKKSGKFLILKLDDINVRESIKGPYNKNIKIEESVLTYDYYTLNQYNLKYMDKDLWLSFNNSDAVVFSNQVKTLNMKAGDAIYESYNGSMPIYSFTENVSLNSVFTYNGYNYVEYNNVKGWVKETLKEEEPVIKPEKTSKKIDLKKPTTIEIVIVLSLAVVVILSLTSLLALVLMEKSAKKQQGKNETTVNDENKKSEDDINI